MPLFLKQLRLIATFLLLILVSTASNVRVGQAAAATLVTSSSVAVPGQRVYLMGTGFSSGESIVFWWDNGRVTGSARTNAGGSFSGTFISLPLDSTTATHRVVAEGITSRRKATLFITVPPCALGDVPLLAAPSQRFLIRGSGFGAGEGITFSWDGKLLPGWRVVTNAQGNFTGSYGHVPGSTTEGMHLLSVRGQATGRSAQVRMMITHKPVSSPAPHTGGATGSPPLSPIVTENRAAGTSSWQIQVSANHHEIEGYASSTSVPRGGSISLYVNTKAPSFRIDVYRMGWYQGQGGRFYQSIAALPGGIQPTCPMAARGLVSCLWKDSFVLNVPMSWMSGVYLAKLTTNAYKLSSGTAAQEVQSYISFVVRDDTSTSLLLFQTSVMTYEAYNDWGGKSLYGEESGEAKDAANQRANAVSFDRPYSRGLGAGDFFYWEYPMLRWLEKNGYNVTYQTDIDTHALPGSLLHHKAFLSVGHDEYWSRSMRDHVEQALAKGVSLGFFGANMAFWQIRLEPSSIGQDRVLVCYKDKVIDPISGHQNDLVTTKWRDPLLNRREDALIGQMWESWFHGSGFAFRPVNTTAWPYAGTGLRDGDSLPGIVGYEYDRMFPDAPQPKGVVILASSPVTTVDGKQSTANTTLYTAPSGARVFAAGTIQWSWGLDDAALVVGLDEWSKHHVAQPSLQRFTNNLLNNFIGT